MSTSNSIFELYATGVAGNVTTKIFDMFGKNYCVIPEAVYVRLVTDATAVTRNVRLNLNRYKNGWKTLILMQSVDHIQSLTKDSCFSKLVGAAVTNGQVTSLPLPKDIVRPYEYLDVSIIGGVAGDVYSVSALGTLQKVVSNV